MKTIISILVLAVGLMASTSFAGHSEDFRFSFNIGVGSGYYRPCYRPYYPPVVVYRTVPAYCPPPAYYYAPVYVAPQPVVVAPPTVIYAPPPPPSVYYYTTTTYYYGR